MLQCKQKDIAQLIICKPETKKIGDSNNASYVCLTGH